MGSSNPAPSITSAISLAFIRAFQGVRSERTVKLISTKEKPARRLPAELKYILGMKGQLSPAAGSYGGAAYLPSTPRNRPISPPIPTCISVLGISPKHHSDWRGALEQVRRGGGDADQQGVPTPRRSYCPDPPLVCGTGTVGAPASPPGFGLACVAGVRVEPGAVPGAGPELSQRAKATPIRIKMRPRGKSQRAMREEPRPQASVPTVRYRRGRALAGPPA